MSGFIDDATRLTMVFPISDKKSSTVLPTFKEVCRLLGNKNRIKRLHTDGGGEYVGEEWNVFLDKHSIIHDTTTPYAPEQNLIIERFLFLG